MRTGLFAVTAAPVQDITALVTTEEALKAERDRADAANAAKTEFLATMSHDLRTPLTAIIGFTEIIRQCIHGNLGDPRNAEYVERIHQNSHRLMSLIDDILDLSRIESAEYTLSEEWIDMAGEIESSRRRCAPEAVNHDYERIGVDIVEPGLRLYGDSRAVSQILDNLLSNAIKYSEADTSITVQWVSNARGEGLLHVVDAGHGIPKDRLETIKMPFVRGIDGAGEVNQRAGTSDGTGLGLPTSFRVWPNSTKRRSPSTVRRERGPR